MTAFADTIKLPAKNKCDIGMILLKSTADFSLIEKSMRLPPSTDRIIDQVPKAIDIFKTLSYIAIDMKHLNISNNSKIHELGTLKFERKKRLNVKT